MSNPYDKIHVGDGYVFEITELIEQSTAHAREIRIDTANGTVVFQPDGNIITITKE